MDVTPALPRRVRVGYSLGSLATGAFGTMSGLLLPKAWDVVLDPVVGRVSDRTVSRMGARRPAVLAVSSTVDIRSDRIGGLTRRFWLRYGTRYG